MPDFDAILAGLQARGAISPTQAPDEVAAAAREQLLRRGQTPEHADTIAQNLRSARVRQMHSAGLDQSGQAYVPLAARTEGVAPPEAPGTAAERAYWAPPTLHQGIEYPTLRQDIAHAQSLIAGAPGAVAVPLTPFEEKLMRSAAYGVAEAGTRTMAGLAGSFGAPGAQAWWADKAQAVGERAEAYQEPWNKAARMVGGVAPYFVPGVAPTALVGQGAQIVHEVAPEAGAGVQLFGGAVSAALGMGIAAGAKAVVPGLIKGSEGLVARVLPSRYGWLGAEGASDVAGRAVQAAAVTGAENVGFGLGSTGGLAATAGLKQVMGDTEEAAALGKAALAGVQPGALAEQFAVGTAFGPMAYRGIAARRAYELNQRAQMEAIAQEHAEAVQAQKVQEIIDSRAELEQQILERTDPEVVAEREYLANKEMQDRIVKERTEAAFQRDLAARAPAPTAAPVAARLAQEGLPPEQVANAIVQARLGVQRPEAVLAEPTAPKTPAEHVEAAQTAVDRALAPQDPRRVAIEQRAEAERRRIAEEPLYAARDERLQTQRMMEAGAEERARLAAESQRAVEEQTRLEAAGATPEQIAEGMRRFEAEQPLYAARDERLQTQRMMEAGAEERARLAAESQRAVEEQTRLEAADTARAQTFEEAGRKREEAQAQRSVEAVQEKPPLVEQTREQMARPERLRTYMARLQEKNPDATTQASRAKVVDEMPMPQKVRALGAAVYGRGHVERAAEILQELKIDKPTPGEVDRALEMAGKELGEVPTIIEGSENKPKAIRGRDLPPATPDATDTGDRYMESRRPTEEGMEKDTGIDSSVHKRVQPQNTAQKRMGRMIDAIARKTGTRLSLEFYDAGDAAPHFVVRKDGSYIIRLSSTAKDLHGDFAHELLHFAAERLPPEMRAKFYDAIEAALGEHAPDVLAKVREIWGEDANHREEALAEAARWMSKRDPDFFSRIAGIEPTIMAKIRKILERLAAAVGIRFGKNGAVETATDRVVKDVFEQALRQTQPPEPEVSLVDRIAQAAGEIAEPDPVKRAANRRSFLRQFLAAGQGAGGVFTTAADRFAGVAPMPAVARAFRESRAALRLSVEEAQTQNQIIAKHAPVVQELNRLAPERAAAVGRALLHFRMQGTDPGEFGEAFTWTDPLTKFPTRVQLSPEEVALAKRAQDVGRSTISDLRDGLLALAGLPPGTDTAQVPRDQAALRKTLQLLDSASATNYFPLMRFGKHMVKSGDLAVSFESQNEAVALHKKLLAADPEAQLIDLEAKDAYTKLGMDSGGLAELAQKSGVSEDAIKQFLTPALVAAMAAKPAGGRFAKAQMLAGASEDPGRVLGHYVGSMAGFSARALYSHRIADAVAKGVADATAVDPRDGSVLGKVLRSWQEDRHGSIAKIASAVKQATSLHFLGANLGSAAGNAMQAYVLTPAHILRIAVNAGLNPRESLRAFTAGLSAHMRAIARPGALPADLIPDSVTGAKREAMLRAADGGQFGAHAGDMDTGFTSSRVIRYPMIPFMRVEVGNRMAAWSHGYDMAERQRNSSRFWDRADADGYDGERGNAEQYADWFNREMNVDMHRSAKSALERSSTGSVATGLLSYTIAQMYRDLGYLSETAQKRDPRLALGFAAMAAAVATALGMNGHPLTATAQAIIDKTQKKPDDILAPEHHGLPYKLVQSALSGEMRETALNVLSTLERKAGVRYINPVDLVPTQQNPYVLPVLGAVKTTVGSVERAVTAAKEGDTRTATIQAAKALGTAPGRAVEAAISGSRGLGGEPASAVSRVTSGLGFGSEAASKSGEIKQAVRDRRQEGIDASRALTTRLADAIMEKKDIAPIIKDITAHNAEMLKAGNYESVLQPDGLKMSVTQQVIERTFGAAAAGAYGKRGKSSALDYQRGREQRGMTDAPTP